MSGPSCKKVCIVSPRVAKALFICSEVQLSSGQTCALGCISRGNAENNTMPGYQHDHVNSCAANNIMLDSCNGDIMTALSSVQKALALWPCRRRLVDRDNNIVRSWALQE